MRQTTPTDRLGRPLRDLRISVTDRCQHRCPYCMPAEAMARHRFLPREQLLSFEEITRLVRLLTGLGVARVRLTGGEPLLRRELDELVRRLVGTPGVEEVALTTNGELLARHAVALARAGLHRVTVSLDALDPEVFLRTTGGRGSVAQVLEGIEAARAAGLPAPRINCVVQRGQNEQEILPLVRHFRHSGSVVRFIEYMDVGTLNRWDLTHVVDAAEVVATIAREHPVEELPRERPSATARRWRLADGSLEFGVVASVSAPFCGGCTRLRLGSDGQLYTCLFSTRGHDLRGPLRAGEDDDALRERLLALWGRREDRYSERRAHGEGDDGDRVEMFRVGG